MITLMGIRWVRHVTCKRGERTAYKVLVEKLKERNHYRDLNLDRRIISSRVCVAYKTGVLIG
jgi:hypothetical protein